MLPAHQLQGEFSISAPRHRHPRETITRARDGFRTFAATLALNVFLHIKIFCTAKSFKALQKVAKMPETTREFGF
jgi:hypothetical protein